MALAPLPFRPAISLVLRVLLVAVTLSCACTPFAQDTPGADAAFTSGRLDGGSTSTHESGSPPHAGSGQSASEAGPRCNPDLPFKPAMFVPVPATVATTWLGGMRLSVDSLTAYFFRAETGGSADLFFATRATLSAPFGNVTALGGSDINTAFQEFDPTVSGDGLTLVFARFGAPGTPGHLNYATRDTGTSPFAYRGELLDRTGVVASDDGPFLREDGQALYFGSTRVSEGKSDIFRTTRNESGFDPPQPVAELLSAYEDAYPVVTPDDLTIYFASTRAGHGLREIWVAKRASRSEPFSAPTPVPELTMGIHDQAPTFATADGCTLFFSVYFQDDATAAHGRRIEYVAERPAR